MKYQLIKHKVLESTSNYLEYLLEKEDLPEGTVIMSEYQKNGKGMLKNSWQSEAGKNLLFSLLLKPAYLTVANQFYLSKSISLAIHDMLTDIINPELLQIKWPNDIYISSKKVSGILIKCNLRNTTVQQAIIGIGININQNKFQPDFEATSVINECGNKTDIEAFLEFLLIKINSRIEQLKSKEYAEIDLQYHRILLGYNIWMEYGHLGSIFKGKIKEVGKDGLLLLEKQGGILEKFELKEINLISTQPV